MARKGSKKVKTGCLTCKIRKVKCDETKPFCERCIKTGRKCDGYLPPKTTSNLEAASAASSLVPSWYFSSPCSGLNPVVSADEARALEFFQSQVAPTISGHLEDKFWTHFVLQVGQQEPAVRHAATCISALYEQFGQPAVSEADNAFALRHYNQSIKELVSNKDERVVLLVCIMMICVEFLQGHIQAAIGHCRHGISILNNSQKSPWMKEYILPIFCRQSIFPFFFGCTPENFPLLDDLESLMKEYLPSTLKDTTLSKLQCSQDIILCRAIRFVRMGDTWRKPDSVPVPDAYVAEQGELESLLAQWKRGFQQFKKGRVLFQAETTACFILEMRYLLTDIWVNTALEDEEMAYDRHLDKFQGIVNMATLVLATKVGAPRPKFIFEMGYLPLLYFVAIKCRDFRTRLAALQSMRALGVNREILWDVDVMYDVARKVIEMEHGIRVDGIELQPLKDRGADQLSKVLEMVMEPKVASAVEKPTKRVSFATRKTGSQGFVFREKVIDMKLFGDNRNRKAS